MMSEISWWHLDVRLEPQPPGSRKSPHCFDATVARDLTGLSMIRALRPPGPSFFFKGFLSRPAFPLEEFPIGGAGFFFHRPGEAVGGVRKFGSDQTSVW